jgi:hypothetical protein
MVAETLKEGNAYMDTNLLITLLSIAVILLAVVIITWLTAVTLVLFRLRQLLKDIEAITTNVASASEWLSPVKVLSQITKLFRK